MSKLQLLFFLFVINWGVAQTTDQIMFRYNQIQKEEKGSVRINEIKQLYELSKKQNFRKGILRGAMILQRELMMSNNYQESDKYGNEAEKAAKELKDYDALSTINLARGRIDIIIDKIPEARTYLETAVKYANMIENEADRNLQLSKIYANYIGMAEGEGVKDFLENTKKGLHYIEITETENLTESQKEDYYYLYSSGLINMGTYYFYIQNPPDLGNAEYYYTRALKLRKSYPKYLPESDTDIYQYVSNFYIAKKDYQKAIQYSLKFLKGEKTQKDPRGRLFSYRNLKDAYHGLKNLDEENKYLRLYTTLNDSINQLEKKEIVSQSRNKIQEADAKMYHFMIIGGVIIILIIGLLIFYRVRDKNTRKNYQQMLQILKTEKLNAYKNKTPENRADISIATDTEQKILANLEEFELSEMFLQKDITIGMLSSEFNTNHTYLSGVIRNYRSANFNQYINNLRINYIVHKLYNDPKYREYKISYLADEAGFTSRQVFVQAFKKINGVTPSYFIQNLEKEEQ